MEIAGDKLMQEPFTNDNKSAWGANQRVHRLDTSDPAGFIQAAEPPAILDGCEQRIVVVEHI